MMFVCRVYEVDCVIVIALSAMGKAYLLMSQPQEAQNQFMTAKQLIENCQENDSPQMLHKHAISK